MAPIVHAFDPPDRFVVGTVGPPGQRTFFVQARDGRRLVSVSLEKQQVAVLAERIDELLDDLLDRDDLSAVVPVLAPLDLVDNEPLEQPIEEEFRAGTMTLSWDGTDERVVIEVFPFDETAIVPGVEGDEEPDESQASEVLLVRISAGVARAFVKRARMVIESGRPDCPFCGRPIDPEGHLCVRANGFLRRPA